MKFKTLFRIVQKKCNTSECEYKIIKPTLFANSDDEGLALRENMSRRANYHRPMSCVLPTDTVDVDSAATEAIEHYGRSGVYDSAIYSVLRSCD